MELVERIPTKKIAFINSFDFKKFKQYTPSCKSDEERKTKFNMMRAFCQNNIKARGEIKRLYSYTQQTPLEVGGRLYCGNSIQGLQKSFRGFLMEGVSTDIDMKNAHPVILKYICKINNIPCPNLTWYVENRDEVLKNFDEQGKTLFLKAVNDDKLSKKCTHSFFKDFDKECKKIQKEIYKLECYKHIVESVPTTRMYNFLGSAINRVLCVYENKILQSVISVCNSKQIEICSLMFDGLLIYGDHYSNNDLLREIEQRVNNDFEGINMVFAYKRHSTDIIMPPDYEEMPTNVKIEDGRSFDDISSEFEKQHCKINHNGIFIKETDDKIIVMNKSHITTAYEHMTYDKLTENKSNELVITQHNFIKDWLVNNDSQRSYDTMGCYPNGNECPENCYNTWRPFAMELMNDWEDMPDAVDVFRNHIKILCDNDEVVSSYIEAWIAQMIQYPAVKTICPTLISKEGAGKGTLMMLLKKMLGESKYFETTTPSTHIFGQFNGHMSDSFLINLDEMSKKEVSGFDGQFKALTTNPHLTINEKGVKSYNINSYHRFIITTNNEDPINSKKDDRRNLIIRSSDELIGNTEYFNKIYKLLDNENVIKSCYEYFKQMPNMDKFRNIPLPKTQYQEDIKEASVSPIELWLIDFAKSHSGSDDVTVTASTMFSLFTSFCSKCGIKYEVSNVQFAVRLKRLNVSGVGDIVHTKHGNKRVMNVPKLIEHFKIDLTDDLTDEPYEDDSSL